MLHPLNSHDLHPSSTAQPTHLISHTYTRAREKMSNFLSEFSRIFPPNSPEIPPRGYPLHDEIPSVKTWKNERKIRYFHENGAFFVKKLKSWQNIFVTILSPFHSPPASNSLDLRVHNSSKRPILESARDRAPMEEFIFGFMRLGPTSFKFNSCEPHLSSQILIGSHEFCLSV